MPHPKRCLRVRLTSLPDGHRSLPRSSSSLCWCSDGRRGGCCARELQGRSESRGRSGRSQGREGADGGGCGDARSRHCTATSQHREDRSDASTHVSTSAFLCSSCSAGPSLFVRCCCLCVLTSCSVGSRSSGRAHRDGSSSGARQEGHGGCWEEGGAVQAESSQARIETSGTPDTDSCEEWQTTQCCGTPAPCYSDRWRSVCLFEHHRGTQISPRSKRAHSLPSCNPLECTPLGAVSTAFLRPGIASLTQCNSCGTQSSTVLAQRISAIGARFPLC